MTFDASFTQFLPAGLMALCLLLLMVLIFLKLGSQKRTQRMLHQFLERITEEMEALEDGQYQHAAQQRDENLRSLHQLNESLVTTFGNLSRTQSERIRQPTRGATQLVPGEGRAQPFALRLLRRRPELTLVS